MPKKIQLSLEERETLLEITQSEGLPVLYKLCEQICSSMADRLINTSLTSENETSFIYEKCRIEGATKLVVALKEYLSGTKKE